MEGCDGEPHLYDDNTWVGCYGCGFKTRYKDWQRLPRVPKGNVWVLVSRSVASNQFGNKAHTSREQAEKYRAEETTHPDGWRVKELSVQGSAPQLDAYPPPPVVYVVWDYGSRTVLAVHAKDPTGKVGAASVIKMGVIGNPQGLTFSNEVWAVEHEYRGEHRIGELWFTQEQAKIRKRHGELVTKQFIHGLPEGMAYRCDCGDRICNPGKVCPECKKTVTLIHGTPDKEPVQRGVNHLVQARRKALSAAATASYEIGQMMPPHHEGEPEDYFRQGVLDCLTAVCKSLDELESEVGLIGELAKHLRDNPVST
jgi:hypothetical protein